METLTEQEQQQRTPGMDLRVEIGDLNRLSAMPTVSDRSRLRALARVDEIENTSKVLYDALKAISEDPESRVTYKLQKQAYNALEQYEGKR